MITVWATTFFSWQNIGKNVDKGDSFMADVQNFNI